MTERTAPQIESYLKAIAAPNQEMWDEALKRDSTFVAEILAFHLRLNQGEILSLMLDLTRKKLDTTFRSLPRYAQVLMDSGITVRNTLQDLVNTGGLKIQGVEDFLIEPLMMEVLIPPNMPQNTLVHGDSGVYLDTPIADPSAVTYQP